MRVRSQKLIHWSRKHAKKRSFLKSFHKRASLKSGIPEMCHLKSRIPEMGQLKSEIPELSWPISGFLELWWHISGIPDLRLALSKNFLVNFVFLVCFSLQWISFWLLTLIYSDDMYILQKNWSKTLIPAWNKGSNILLPHIWSHHRLLCSMTKLKEHSREICYNQVKTLPLDKPQLQREKVKYSDLRFVKKFTRPDFLAKNFAH